MKTWGPQIFFLIIIMLSSASAAFAQDAGMSDVEIMESEISAEDKTVFTPGEEVRYVPKAVVMMPKDSVALQMHDFPMQRAAQKPVEKTSDKQGSKSKDDSILTFNFLYYIIQKYKLQDVID